MNGSVPLFRRRRYLIKWGLQLRYMAIIVLSMFMVSTVVGWIIYQTSWSQIVQTDNLSVDKLADIFDAVNRKLVKWIIVLIIGMAILSIFVSHRIAGPVYRFEQMTKVIASGDLTKEIRLRQDDELKDLAENFNMMIRSLREIVKKDREIVKRLLDISNRIVQQLDSKNIDRGELEDISKNLHLITEELSRITSGFKISEEDFKEEKEK